MRRKMTEIQNSTSSSPVYFPEPATPARLTRLSPREYQVLHLLAQRMPTKAIGQKLNLSVSSVNGYVRAIYMRLGINGRMELGAWIARHFDSSASIPTCLPRCLKSA